MNSIVVPPGGRVSKHLAIRSDKPLAVFDVDRLHGELEFDLPKALRGIADAIEAGNMDGVVVNFTPSGDPAYPGDERIHLFVKLHLASAIRKRLDLDKLEQQS